jgi:hypothetical protein
MDYNNALEKLETSIYPDVRKKYLKMSHKNLINIMRIEQTYFKNIELVNKGEAVDESVGPEHATYFPDLEFSDLSDNAL